MTRTVRFPAVEAPRTEERPVSDTHHGITRTDEYAWLRADNWQEVFKDPGTLDPAIRAHLEAENAYQAAMLGDEAELRKRLFEEMKGRIKEDDSSVPMKDGPFAYGSSYKKGGEQPRFFRTPRDGGRRRDHPRRRPRSRGQALFPHRRQRPFERPRPPHLVLRRQGIGILQPARSRCRHGARSRRPGARHQRRRCLERRQ